MNKRYKKFFTAFLFCLSFCFCKAQWVTIPDPNFVTYLQNQYPGCMNGNLMDTTCSGIVNEAYIGACYWNISNIDGIQYFDSLKYLQCCGNSLSNLPDLPSTLTGLDCWENNLTSLPILPATLTGLNCGTNQLSSLPVLPPTLTVLAFDNNFLSSILLPPSLTYFSCSNNLFTSLPSLPSGLTYLNCSDNNLTSLPALPSTLITLLCYLDQLTSLPALPSSLEKLRCHMNNLTSLPALPSTLTELTCYSNQLTSLPALPASLNYLQCQTNQLTIIPPLPPALITLLCSQNYITSLPTLPSSLDYLGCSFNQLTSLPSLPSTLTNLHCNNNLLSSLPELPDSLYYLHINNNSSLSCLPKYKKINYLYWDSTSISCLPNLGYIGVAFPTINLPLCQPASGCDFYWNQFGKVYNDTNLNCINDTTEHKLKNIPVLLDSAGSNLQVFVTNNEGYYSFETGLGNYQIKIDTAGLPFDVACPAGGSYTSLLTAVDSLDADLDFGVLCKPGYLDLTAKSISTSAQLRPGTTRKIYLNAGDATLFYGVTCSSGISGTVTAVLNGPVAYSAPANGALTPSIINGDTLIWNVADFSLTNPTQSFNVVVQVDSSAAIGNTVCFDLSIATVATDNNPSNNFISHCFPIVNSFDPNAKEIYPGGFVDSSMHAFTFTVWFQNTGNAVAENIYIMDTLDADLDASTFQFLSGSHDGITQLLPGNILRFSFPQIMLADSNSNEPASHGYVQFKINRADTVYNGMVILNTAHIFFDLNLPVATNEAYAYINFDCNGLIALSVSDTTVCAGDNISFGNNATFPFAITNDWYVDSVFNSSSQSFSFSSPNAGNYNVMLNASNTYCSISQTQNITVFPLPAQPVINIAGDTLSTTVAATYQWYVNNTSISGATQNNFVITQSGYYSVLITDSNGCNALSDSVFVSPLGIIEISSASFSIIPNPVINNEISIAFRSAITNNNSFFEIADVTGKIVFSKTQLSNQPQQIFHLPHLSAGLYNCIVTSGKERFQKKLVVSYQE